MDNISIEARILEFSVSCGRESTEGVTGEFPVPYGLHAWLCIWTYSSTQQHTTGGGGGHQLTIATSTISLLHLIKRNRFLVQIFKISIANALLEFLNPLPSHMPLQRYKGKKPVEI